MCLRKDVSLPLTGDNMNTIKKSLKDRVWDYLIKNEKYIWTLNFTEIDSVKSALSSTPFLLSMTKE